MGMIPNIRQRKDAANRGKSHRRQPTYSTVASTERRPDRGIFGVEETRRHQLHCQFVREDNRRRFAKGRTIAWNIRVFNRFECANRLNIPIPPTAAWRTWSAPDDPTRQ